MNDPYKKVFIIGNGFDLDLGMKTRYSDFAKSDQWPFENSILALAGHLNNRSKIDKWLDLESELLIYAQNTKSSYQEGDQRAFVNLVNQLTLYLKTEEQKKLRTDSVAAQVLAAIIENGYFESIYSFNYTDLHGIASKLGIPTEFSYEHVHGSIKDNTLILGIEEQSDVKQGYEFLYKTFSSYYESHSIQYDLQEANEVVFFGHSLGHNDYHYFQTFFQMQCLENMSRKDSKRITIFTYDDTSRIEILKQLRNMNDKKTALLFNQNKMEIICTNGGGEKRLTDFLKRMKEESVVEDNREVRTFESQIY